MTDEAPGNAKFQGHFAPVEPDVADGPAINPQWPALQFDPTRHRHLLRDFDLSDTAKSELLDSVWDLGVGVVDYWFGIHPLQRVLPASMSLEVDSPSVVASKDISEQTNGQAVAPESGSAGESD
jgi:hypothetical protein